MTTFYITKYALTKGILTWEGEISTFGPQDHPMINPISGVYFHNYEFTTSPEEAQTKAKNMVEKKLRSLEKQRKTLEKMLREPIKVEPLKP